ncbi:MAG: DUF1501 domain-containing protein [Rhizobacter sp.]|nr:DUF1501 domain-containing protein [Ferruginibacter sp.]
MQRRKFLQTTGSLTIGSILLNGISVKGSPLAPPFTCPEIHNRILVMVNLFGANDTLNTVVPMQQYSIYATNRPNIRIPDTGAGKYLELDATLPADQQTAIHPIMTPFKALYDAGKLNVVHGVGYLNNNRSHFKSDDLWNTAGDSTPANFDFMSGWAGDLFEYRYPGLLGNPNSAMPDPPCIELGATSGSTLFQTANSNNASILLTTTNVSSYYNTLVAVGGPAPANFPVSDFGNDLHFIDDVQRLSNVYAQRIQTVFNAGSNSTTVYPNTNIANQLKTVARLIKGGSKSSMYTVHQYGFDTHGTQVVAGSPTTGTHANLLRDLTAAIKAFQDDIGLLGFEDRVITTTHSEFGRTIDENSGLGTDHGGVSTMFIIGKGVRPGVTGKPIDLTKVSSRGLTDLQFDYRRVWSAVLQDFMGHGTQPMSAARMSGYLTEKAPIIADTHKAPPGCYIDYVVLPVTLASLDARLLQNGSAEIFWETSSEANCKEFEIQHSRDNINWTAIGTVAGNGDSNILRRYKITHPQPFFGLNYYRLWQVDFNGSKRQFGPAVLNVRNKKGFDVSVYPNPAVFDFNIAVTADKEQKGIINLYDIQGHLLQSRPVTILNGFNKFNFLTAQLRNYKGEIIIHIKTDNAIERTFKQLIQ